MYTILVPMDGSDHALKALHIACDLADKYRARITLLHIITTGKMAHEILGLPLSQKFSPALFASLQAASEANSEPLNKALLQDIGDNILKIAAARVRRLGLDAHLLPIKTGDPVQNILSARKLISASTIVMGSRGIDPAAPMAEVSISRAVFAKADCTCISVK